MKKQLQKDWKDDLPASQEDQLFQKALRQKLDRDYRQKWGQQLAEQGLERKTSAKIVSLKKKRRFLSLAAAVLILLVGGWWLFFQNGDAVEQQLADQYLSETSQQLAQVRMGGDEENLDLLWQSARTFYTQQNYEAAIKDLENLAIKSSLESEQTYMLALSYLQLSPPAYEKSLEQLSLAQLANNAAGTDSYKIEIKWVRALILIKKGDEIAAKKALGKIAVSGGWYAKKAKEILKELL